MNTAKQIKAALTARFGRTFNVSSGKSRYGTMFAISAPTNRTSERGFGFCEEESNELAKAMGLPEWQCIETFCFWDTIANELIENLSRETPVDLTSKYRHPYGAKAPNSKR